MRLEDYLAKLTRRIDELEQRLDQSVRHGTVSDVDASKQQIRMRIGGTDAEPLKSPWVPYGQIAGAMKIHSMPSVGQTMTLYSPTGDLRQGIAMPGSWSDANPSPSDKPGDHVLIFENVRVELRKDQLLLKVGDVSLDITKDKIVAKVSESEIEISASAINLIATDIFTVGSTFAGVDTRNEKVAAKIITTAGNAKKSYSKPP